MAVNDKSEEKNSLPRSTTIFNDPISKRKKIMSELHDSVDYNYLHFEYLGPTKNISFYEYVDSEGFFK